MTVQKAGWYDSAGHPNDYQWWDGARWCEAYWPQSRPEVAYLREARRWDISASGSPHFDIVGENWHKEHIAEIVGGRPQLDHEVEKYATAELVPEPDNPHDHNAISVRIKDGVVGYLPSEVAGKYVQLVHFLVRANIVPTVNARIWAVTRSTRFRGEEIKSAIRLALPEPHSVLPLNEVPVSAHAVIPTGRTVQVTGESEHGDVLVPYMGKDGRLVVTLHPLEIAKPRSSLSVLEVRVDGQRVGQLTPTTSASLMPLIAAVDAQGLVAAAWATVSGSRLAPELTLKVAKTEHIPATWPSPTDAIPTIKPVQAVPPSYMSTDPIPAAPIGTGLSTGFWVLGVIVALLLFAMPYVGWIFGLALLVGMIIRHRRAKRQPPRSAEPTPQQIFTSRDPMSRGMK